MQANELSHHTVLQQQRANGDLSIRAAGTAHVLQALDHYTSGGHGQHTAHKGTLQAAQKSNLVRNACLLLGMADQACWPFSCPVA